MRIPAVLVAVITTILFAGCEHREGGHTTNPVVAVIPKGTSHEFWKTVHAGANEAGSKNDLEIIWKGPAREDDRDEQIKVVETFVARGVDAIVIAPLDDTALVPSLKEASGRGIPVIVFDSDIKWDGKTTFVATDNTRGGELAAREVGRLLDGKGRILVMRYVEGSASTMKREKGFLDTIASEYPGIEVVSSNQHGGATVEGCYKTAENLLAKYPDVDAVFGPCEPATFGLMKAIDDIDKEGTILLVGFDASDKLVEGLRDGKIAALVVQNPFAMGDLAVTAARSTIDGDDVPEFMDTGCTLITLENMDEPGNKELLNPPLDKWLNTK